MSQTEVEAAPSWLPGRRPEPSRTRVRGIGLAAAARLAVLGQSRRVSRSSSSHAAAKMANDLHDKYQASFKDSKAQPDANCAGK
jgi:hypothetical protein